MRKKFLGLLTRCKDEFFVKEFCDYYLSQGVDKIYIIDDNSIDRAIYNFINDERVEIIFDEVKNKCHESYKCEENCLCNRVIANKIYSQIKNNFEWLIYVDVDEFITTTKKLDRTIKNELQTTFKKVDCVKIPWVMMACNNREKNPKSVLLENIYRCNHDKKHPNPVRKFRCRYDSVEVKCIFRPNKFIELTDHFPIPFEECIITESIKYRGQRTKIIHNNYLNLREDDIKNGTLLCYHYRIISRENSFNKIKNNNWYKENNYNINDLMSSDYPEIIDETLRYKTQIRLFNKHEFKDLYKNNLFLGLITRCKDEPYVSEFCEYYLNQGVDKIYIIDDNSNELSNYYMIKSDKVEIIYLKNNSKCHDGTCKDYCTCNRVMADLLYKKIRNNFEWMIYVDVDEFITTRKNIKKTLRDELLTTYKDIDCISVPWIIMSAVDKINPWSLQNRNIYRINYDKKPFFTCSTKIGRGKFTSQSSGRQAQCKSIFKCKFFNAIHDKNNPSDHNPLFCNKKKNVKWVESIYNTEVPLYYKNYHKEIFEKCIENSYLVCYHFRIISEEHAKKKLITNNWYIENGYKLSDLMKTNDDIVDPTLKYKKKNNDLKFVHITKTSGSYIEDIALEKNIFWGRFDDKLQYLKIKYLRTGHAFGSPWHEPIVYLNEKPYNENTKLFTIVRNPYDRIISECCCEWGTKFVKELKTKDDFNKYITERVSKANELDFSFHHFLPQHIYTHDSNKRQIVDYIIKYENIDEFNALMKLYSIEIKYKKNISAKKKKFSVDDISNENLKLINKVYELDFILLKYDIKN